MIPPSARLKPTLACPLHPASAADVTETLDNLCSLSELSNVFKLASDGTLAINFTETGVPYGATEKTQVTAKVCVFICLLRTARQTKPPVGLAVHAARQEGSAQRLHRGVWPDSMRCPELGGCSSRAS